MKGQRRSGLVSCSRSSRSSSPAPTRAVTTSAMGWFHYTVSFAAVSAPGSAYDPAKV
jgi:hypothetical protein